MNVRPQVGITLQPERRYWDLVAPLAEKHADYVEVAPETLWRPNPDGTMVPNSYGVALGEWLARTNKPVVAHGVGLSLGTVDPRDQPRFAVWLTRIAQDHQRFRFQWYTDHLGATVLAGQLLTLPLALPMHSIMAAVVRDRLAALQRIVPDVGFENSVFYFLLGRWLDKPAFFAQILTTPRMHLLLDLHNVFTMAINLQQDPEEYLARLNLDQVIEIHLSGGSRSDPAWLPSARTLRLDSHDSAVPEPVWQLYERVVRRCPNLRGVTLERMEGTVDAADVPRLCQELRRAREVLRAHA